MTNLSLCPKCLELIGDRLTHVAWDVTPDGVVVIIDGKRQPPHPHDASSESRSEVKE